MNAPTHILHWVPGYLNSDGNGLWELQHLADYAAGLTQLHPGWRLEDEPRDIDAADFTGWIAGLVGCPVTVQPWANRVTCWRHLRFRRREPAFLIAPVASCPYEICHHNACAACGNPPAEADPLVLAEGVRIHLHHVRDPEDGFYGVGFQAVAS
jgi:hypothetical protein